MKVELTKDWCMNMAKIEDDAKCDQMHAELEDLKRCHSNNVRNLMREADDLRDLLHRMLEAPTTQISVGWKRELQQALVRK